jgi:hypothetical protein
MAVAEKRGLIDETCSQKTMCDVQSRTVFERTLLLFRKAQSFTTNLV